MRVVQLRQLSLLAALGLGLAFMACGPTLRPGEVIDSGTGDLPDARINPFDDADITDDGGGLCGDNLCLDPVDDLCGDAEVCGNGLDDDCDGRPDGDCTCVPGAVQACFQGQPGRRDVGACVDGTQRCQGEGEFAAWGPCEGGISPRGEVCDSQDNNCNGCEDDHPSCCDVTLRCPGPTDMPEGAPFTPYVIDGTNFYGGPVVSWQWSVRGGPCDQLLAPAVSFALSGANTNTLTFTPRLSGDYTVRLRMVLPDGTVNECEFIVHVRGPGLRVELCWTPRLDLDLHLHKPNDTSPWFTPAADCFYASCTAGDFLGGGGTDWGYASSPLDACVGGPEGTTWQSVGECKNPRLDIDNVFQNGRPENTNIDVPADGETYRVAVHYFSGGAVTHPLVNIYCGGRLTGTYGAAPDLVPGFTSGGGPMWHVVDVTPHVDDMGVTTGCDLAQLHPEGMTSGYKVVCANDPEGCVNTAFD